MTDIAKITNLNKWIDGKQVVKNLNFSIKKGEVLGFLGPNGAGKTTTMRMMMGLMSINDGDVEINGYSIRKSKTNALKYVGGIIETPEMYNFLSGYKNLEIFQKMSGDVDKKKILELINLLELDRYIHNKVKTYSLGMRQRLGIAQALLCSPSLLILDEPTNGLDPAGTHEIRNYLKSVSKEKDMAVFVSSHLITEMELLCDRIIIIQNGLITDIENVQQDVDIEKLTKFSIHVTPQEKALNIFEELEITILKIESNHLFIETIYKNVPEIVDKFAENGLKVFSIEPIKNSLEDRFLVKTSGGTS